MCEIVGIFYVELVSLWSYSASVQWIICYSQFDVTYDGHYQPLCIQKVKVRIKLLYLSGNKLTRLSDIQNMQKVLL